jgi:hypothetical protein
MRTELQYRFQTFQYLDTPKNLEATNNSATSALLWLHIRIISAIA